MRIAYETYGEKGYTVKDRVVVDIEIQKTIDETPGGWNSTHLLGVSVGCVWEVSTQRMRIYGPEDLQKLKDRLLTADEIIGYNIWSFDFPVIWGYSRTEWAINSPNTIDAFHQLKAALFLKTNDLLRRIWQALDYDPDRFVPSTHGGWGLDTVAKGTLGRGKIGWGGDAPKWFQAGQWGRLVDYCMDDVILERDLAGFIDRYGFIVNGKTDRVVRIPRLDG